VLALTYDGARVRGYVDGFLAYEQGKQDAPWTPESADAEYIALTQLHGVALVAGKPGLRERAAPIVRTETAESFAEV
jgi:hypothetical protein